MKLLCLLKATWNFIFPKFGAKREEYFIEKLIDFWAENLHLGGEVGLPSFCATFTAAKQF
jgi:hypothetical protein